MEEIIYGRNTVIETIKSGVTVNKLLVNIGEKHGSVISILDLAKKNKIVVQETEKIKMDKLANGENHQGVIAFITEYKYADVEDIVEYANLQNEDPFIVILDNLEDVHNFGAIIRTCESAGVHGIIIPKHNSVSVNSTVFKTSVGAINYTKIARVTNLNETIKYLKEKGLWIYGAEGEGETDIYSTNLKGPIGLVIGSEGNGISRLVKENCDVIVKIPMYGKVNSLNASVSAGVCIYEIVRQRNI